MNYGTARGTINPPLYAHLRDFVRRDLGMALVGLALLAAVVLYVPTLSYGFVGYDDTWLVRDNWVLRHPTIASLRLIFCDLEVADRLTLAPEYLPVRDLSVMFDYAIWGEWYVGFHLTNLLLYLSSILLWFFALSEFGMDRKLVGLAVLLWAVHPSHVESVAWLAERKGLLAMAFAGSAAFMYARFRCGGNRWLIPVACVSAIAAVWSKAHGAFAISSLAALELLLPQRRVSWKRSIGGLAAIALAASLAFVPVFLLARASAVVGATGELADRIETVLGTHGFYVQLAAMAKPNSVSYRIAQGGPSRFDIALGAAALGLLLAMFAVPERQTWKVPREIRVGAAIWLMGWIPVSHIIVPLQMVMVADRYLLLPTLGLCVAAAAVLLRVQRRYLRFVAIAAVVLAAGTRTLEARASWESPQSLWQRAVETNPADGGAWSLYAEALLDAGAFEQARAAVEEGLHYSNAPRLVMRKALLELQQGNRSEGITLMRRAAEAGEYRAMSNLALLRIQDGAVDEALSWARRSVASAPLYANGQRILGKIALETGLPDEAKAAFERAYKLEPTSLDNRFNLALALLALHRVDEALSHLEACLRDPQLAARARALIDQRR